MPKRSLVIVKVAGSSTAAEDVDPMDDTPPSLEPLGAAKEVLQRLAAFNTGPEEPGGTYLWGPGFRVQMPMSGDDDIGQLLMTMTDEDFAWAVLPKMCETNHWSLMDPESGRVLRF